MAIRTITTATTNDWTGHMIDVDDSFWNEYISSSGTDQFLSTYEKGLAQGLITIVE